MRSGVVGWTKSGCFLGVLGLVSLGCAAAPAGPRGPLMGPGVKLATDWSLALSYARLERENESDLEGTSDHYWLNLPLPPRRVELRVSPVSWADMGGDIGWLDGGLDVRVGIPARRGERWAGNVALGMRSGEAGPFKDTKRTRSYWARTELYPLLSESKGGMRTSRRGVFSLGIDVGAFYHQLDRSPTESEKNEDGLGFHAVQLIRDEMRIEAAAGIVLLNERSSVLIALEPYLAFDLETDSGSCAVCARYHQSTGIVLVIDAALFLSFERDPLRR
jgi:hypothetical protein